MFADEPDFNEARMRELRRLTTRALKALNHGQFSLAADLRSRRQRLLNTLSDEQSLISSAA